MSFFRGGPHSDAGFRGVQEQGAGETVDLGKFQYAYSKQEVETLKQVLALGQVLTLEVYTCLRTLTVN